MAFNLKDICSWTVSLRLGVLMRFHPTLTGARKARENAMSARCLMIFFFLREKRLGYVRAHIPLAIHLSLPTLKGFHTLHVLHREPVSKDKEVMEISKLMTPHYQFICSPDISKWSSTFVTFRTIDYLCRYFRKCTVH